MLNRLWAGLIYIITAVRDLLTITMNHSNFIISTSSHLLCVFPEAFDDPNCLPVDGHDRSEYECMLSRCYSRGILLFTPPCTNLCVVCNTPLESCLETRTGSSLLHNTTNVHVVKLKDNTIFLPLTSTVVQMCLNNAVNIGE